MDPESLGCFSALELEWPELENIDIESARMLSRWRPRMGDVHAIHFPDQPLDDRLMESACLSLSAGFRPDFWVFHAHPLPDRMAQGHFLEKLEILLEMLQGRGIKVALRPAHDWAPSLVRLLKSVRCDATGYCWHEGMGDDLDCISDRLFCAVGRAGGSYHELQRLGYRWNMAIPESDMGTNVLEWQKAILDLKARHADVYFPEVKA